MATRVKGGIITDQMLKGKLRFFKLIATGAFEFTVGTDTNGDGTGDPDVIIPNTESGQGVNGLTPYVEKVGIKQPVPNSVAEYAIKAILEKCTISIIRIVDNNEIHIAIENTDNAWDDTSEGPFDFETGLKVYEDEEVSAADNIKAALLELGEITFPNTDSSGGTFDFEANPIDVIEVPFELV